MRKIKKHNNLGNNKFFDAKMGIAGAVVLGTIVFLINSDHGILPAFTASAKQAAYTLLAGGFMMRITENIASHFPNEKLSIFLATLIPSCIAVALTFGLHSMKGTPEPFNSTIPTILMAPGGFLWWAIRKRRQLNSLSLLPQNKKNVKE